MSANRGMVIIIRRGDPAISGTLAEGALKGIADARERAAAEALPHEQVEAVEAEIDRQRIQRALLRVAVGNHKSNEDYDAMITKARGDYGRAPGREGPMRRVGDALLGLYGLMVYGIARAYQAQDALLGGGRAS